MERDIITLTAILAPDLPYGLGGDGLPDPAKLNGSKMVAYVWWCGDEVCDCTQATIQNQSRHDLRTLWQGPFHSDGGMEAYNELRACFAYLTATAPAVVKLIGWPEDYDDPDARLTL